LKDKQSGKEANYLIIPADPELFGVKVLPYDLNLIFVDFSVFNLLEWTNIDGLTEERIYPDYHFKYQQCYSNKKRIKGIDALKQVSGSSNDQGMGELLIYWELQSQKE